jgi:RimJ/RimL family protein N-acetyltransferase
MGLGLRETANVIETQRLTLREFSSGDAAFILQLLNEEGFLRFIGDKGVRTLSDARDYLSQGPVQSYRSHGFGLYLASSREDGTPIGMCGLVKRDALADVDLGFAFLMRYWSMGYAAESAAAVLRYGREALRLKRIVAITAVENQASMAVLRKIGMVPEGKITLVTGGPDLNLFGPAPIGPA